MPDLMAFSSRVDPQLTYITAAIMTTSAVGLKKVAKTAHCGRRINAKKYFGVLQHNLIAVCMRAKRGRETGKWSSLPKKQPRSFAHFCFVPRDFLG